MMKTVKKMYGTYMYERYLFAKEKDRFTRKLKRVTKQLEISGNLTISDKKGSRLRPLALKQFLWQLLGFVTFLASWIG